LLRVLIASNNLNDWRSKFGKLSNSFVIKSSKPGLLSHKACIASIILGVERAGRPTRFRGSRPVEYLSFLRFSILRTVTWEVLNISAINSYLGYGLSF
jgi:hypothetical protein